MNSRGRVARQRLSRLQARADKLDHARAQLANSIVTLPAASVAGAAHKMIAWRRELALQGAGFDQAHDAFAFSAYQDLLRLGGLEAHAHALDGETAALMREYWL